MLDKEKRKEKDRQRYLANKDVRKEKQRQYYAQNRERCKESVLRSQRKRDEKLRLLLCT